MRLDELRLLITNHDDRDAEWHMVQTGPYFTDAADVDDGTFRVHDELLVYKGDVDLTIQSGLQWGHQSRQVTKAADLWDDVAFPDESALVRYADIFWRRSLVDRVSIVIVDGGRATLPVGDRELLNSSAALGPTREKAEWRYFASAYETAVARIVDGGREFDRYFAQAGLTVES